MLTNLPVPYDLYVGVRISRLFTMHGVNAHLAYCLNSVLNVKAVVGAFKPEKALVGAFSMIVKSSLTIV